ncbi:MAG: Gfo/Idh/MocA family oxidoreductase, partial [Gemmatimonadota bacterium]
QARSAFAGAPDDPELVWPRGARVRGSGTASRMGSGNLRFGVVGMGAIGPSHLYAIDHTQGAEVAAICSLPEEKVKTAAAERGVPYFTSVAEMVRAGGLDAATVCTPSGLHLEVALELIAAGLHVLVEKPLEVTVERIDRIVAAAAGRGVTLGAVFQSRHRPVVLRLKELVDDGLLGRIYSGSAYIKRYRTQEYYDSGGWRGTWKIDGGGCLMNQGIHLVDLLTWFCGDVDEVLGVADTVGRQVEVETLAVALLKFASGARGVIEGSTVAFPELPQYLEIYGERGTLTFSNSRIMRFDVIDPTPAEKAAREELYEMRRRLEEAEAHEQRQVAAGTPIPHVDMGHTPVFEDFAAAVRQGRAPAVDGVEARRAVAVINAIYESGRKNSAPVRPAWLRPAAPAACPLP